MNILERSWTSDRSILLSRVMVYIFTAAVAAVDRQAATASDAFAFDLIFTT